MTKCYCAIPEAEYIKHHNICRDSLYDIAESRWFRDFITWSILANTVLMACTWQNEPFLFKNVMAMANYFFATIYTIEAIILIIVKREVYF